MNPDDHDKNEKKKNMIKEKGEAAIKNGGVAIKKVKHGDIIVRSDGKNVTIETSK